jgi:hypothetical protein
MTAAKKTFTFCKYCGGEHTDAIPGVSFDYSLEDELDCLDQAVEVYLQCLTAKMRDELLPMVERLERLIDDIDRVEDSLFESDSLDFVPTLSVLASHGSHGSHGMVDLRPSVVYRAQVALVRAAKAEFTDPNHDNLTALHAASGGLILARADRLDDPPPRS